MILAIVQARMSSTRLPGKVMMPILGRPMIDRQLERVARSRRIDKLLVATSDDPSDDVLVEHLLDIGVPVFRGSLHDVLDRYRHAAVAHGPADIIVRLTADCPMTDPDLIDTVIDKLADASADYCANDIERTWPRGLDAEAFTATALETAWREAKEPDEREHVTAFIYRRPDRFRIAQIRQDRDDSALRWTVDTEKDFAFAKYVYASLYPFNRQFTTEDVMALRHQNYEAEG